MEQTMLSGIKMLIGEQLGSVTFVMDHWQLDFGGSGFTIFSGMKILGPSGETGDGDDFFRDRLCDRITHIVSQADILEDQIVITFEDKYAIAISLIPPRGPEALIFHLHGRPGIWVA